MASPAHSKHASRNRFSLILQLAGSNPGGATLKKKRNTSRRRRDPTSSVGTVQDPDTDYEGASGPYQTADYASHGTSVAGSTSVLSIPASRTRFASSVKDFGGSTSQFDLSSTDMPPIPTLPAPKDQAQKENIKLLKKARKLSKMLGELAIPSAPSSPNRDAQGFSILQDAQQSPRSPTFADAISRTSSRTQESKTPFGHGFTRPYTPSRSPASPSYASRPSLSHDPMPPPFGVHSGAHNMPTELVLRCSSPAGKRDVSNTSSTSRRKNKRRLSLDLSSLVNAGQSILSPPMPERPRSPLDVPRDISGPVIKRSRSLWATKTLKTKGSEEDMRPNPAQAAEERDRIFQDLRSARSESLLTEKQRAINVRRARKMAQMFGSEPPPVLFQITNIPTPSDDELSQLSPIDENKRDSIASTLLSITAADAGAGAGNSPLLTPRERRRPHSIASSIVSVLPHQYDTPLPSPSPFSTFPHPESTSSTRPSSSHSRHTARSSSESDIIAPASFRQRRLRAAKLSRFFGVDLQQLGPEMSSSKSRLPIPGLSRSASLSTKLDSEPRALIEYAEAPVAEGQGYKSGMDVDVKVVSRPGLFNWGSNQRDVDARDVRVKLRQMRVAH